MKKAPLTIVGGISLLISLLIVAVVAFDVTGDGLTEEQRNLALLSLIGLIGNAVPSLLALLKSEDTQHQLQNGLIEKKVENALENTGIVEAANQSQQFMPASVTMMTESARALSLVVERMSPQLDRLEATDHDNQNGGENAGKIL